ncbi:MAG: MCE family protein [Bacteroidia bacterium]|nr:MCE family protein [Bacteroidia bacterium]
MSNEESEIQIKSRRKKTGNGIKLGVFIVTGIILLIAGIYIVGQKQRLFSNVFRVSGVFENVSGLQVGNNIRFSGINVGTVENIEIITDTSVRVDMIIDITTQKFIKKDAKAIIGSDGLMGNKIINITPGSCLQKEIRNGGIIATVRPINMDEMWGQLKTTADNAATITTDLSEIISSIRYGKGSIGKLLMDSSLAEDLDQTLTNVKRGTKGFEENMNAAKHSFLLRNLFKKKNNKEKEKAKAKENGKEKSKTGDEEKKTWREKREARRQARKEN